jgi:hypothetical protein
MSSSGAVTPSSWHGIVAQISCSQLYATFFFHVLEIHLKILRLTAPEIIWILRQRRIRFADKFDEVLTQMPWTHRRAFDAELDNEVLTLRVSLKTIK